MGLLFSYFSYYAPSAKLQRLETRLRTYQRDLVTLSSDLSRANLEKAIVRKQLLYLQSITHNWTNVMDELLSLKILIAQQTVTIEQLRTRLRQHG